MEYDYDLGDYHREVTTSNQDVQPWFTRGLIWAYAFNHEESVRCFEKVVALDPACAMGYWGIAFALGPNYNKPWESMHGEELRATTQRAYSAISEAKKYLSEITELEVALINALSTRHPQAEPGIFDIWNKDYVLDMMSLRSKYPKDLDIAALYCDAMMNVTPWKLWDLKTGDPTRMAKHLLVNEEMTRVLQLEGADDHPGILHLYIHLMEMSPTPEMALPTANRLRDLVPDAGHLQHMPSHIDILNGDYRRAISANNAAIRADEKFLANHPTDHFYNLYRAHDYHFKMYAAMLSGKSKVTLETGAKLAEGITEELLRVESPPMADWLEGFIAMQMHGFIRFGRWEEIIALELPSDPALYCVTTAMMHYAKGVAFAATERVPEAESERALFHESVKRIPASRTIFNNKCTDILNVGSAMLDGEIAYRRGEYDAAFTHLREAARRDDTLPYDEPWGWMQPARHALGALLLEQDRVEEALDVYAADLGIDSTLPRALRHYNNVWASHGYNECLVKLGKKLETWRFASQLKTALSIADIPIKSSCFCRKTT
ncbi:Tetratricopeptide TPR2 [Penicillium brevicompactum]|uniref:Tetratricopeptide-like helical n=1 Tax=Penicillium brevicompactum TaxID=5074 RepID=UPI00253F7FFC|nr:Tetratricopeptide-like helical [Penicillium brevicompactum]KAJ5332906.1 Tetratricopeptide-like helical [Penicillium brevicompactum]